MHEAESTMKPQASPGNAYQRRAKRDGSPMTPAGSARLAGRAQQGAKRAAGDMAAAVGLAPSPGDAALAAALGVQALADNPVFAAVEGPLRIVARMLTDEAFPQDAEARKREEARTLPQRLAELRASRGPSPDEAFLARAKAHVAAFRAQEQAEAPWAEIDYGAPADIEAGFVARRRELAKERAELLRHEVATIRGLLGKAELAGIFLDASDDGPGSDSWGCYRLCADIRRVIGGEAA